MSLDVLSLDAHCQSINLSNVAQQATETWPRSCLHKTFQFSFRKERDSFCGCILINKPKHTELFWNQWCCESFCFHWKYVTLTYWDKEFCNIFCANWNFLKPWKSVLKQTTILSSCKLISWLSSPPQVSSKYILNFIWFFILFYCSPFGGNLKLT